MSLCVRGYTELRSCCLTHFIVLQIRIVWKSQITLFLTLTLCGNQQNLLVLLYNHGEGGLTWAFSWLKAATQLLYLRHYAKQALTPLWLLMHNGQ